MKLRRACMSSQIVIQKVFDEIIYTVDMHVSTTVQVVWKTTYSDVTQRYSILKQGRRIQWRDVIMAFFFFIYFWP